MKIENYIARRIAWGKESKNTVSRSLVKISIAAIVLGMSVMVLTVAIVTGFKQEVRNKVIGFGAHITVTNYDNNSSFETQPVDARQSFYPNLAAVPGIRHIQRFATKPGLIKTKDDIQGVVLKGIGPDFDWSFFEDNLVAGRRIVLQDSLRSNEVLVSKKMADLLRLQLQDKFMMYFMQGKMRWRQFVVVGIYETGFEEYDKMFVLADIKHVQYYSGWNENQISGFEVLIDDYDQLEDMTILVQDSVGYRFNEQHELLQVNNVRNNNPQVFDWLSLSDINVVVMLVIVLVVAVMNMTSSLLIIILERTNMIGMLKAMGATNWSVRNVFLHVSFYLMGRGLLWGNLLGLALCFVQAHWGIITLDPESYYVSTVPISVKLWHVIGLNIGTLAVTLLVLVLPSYVVSRISPIKAIRFN